MTDPILVLIEVTNLVSLGLIVFLYLFSDELRIVTDSAARNFGLWRRGKWSVRNGLTDPILKAQRAASSFQSKPTTEFD